MFVTDVDPTVPGESDWTAGKREKAAKQLSPAVQSPTPAKAAWVSHTPSLAKRTHIIDGIRISRFEFKHFVVHLHGLLIVTNVLIDCP
jgi:hypothetical protein